MKFTKILGKIREVIPVVLKHCEENDHGVLLK